MSQFNKSEQIDMFATSDGFGIEDIVTPRGVEYVKTHLPLLLAAAIDPEKLVSVMGKETAHDTIVNNIFYNSFTFYGEPTQYVKNQLIYTKLLRATKVLLYRNADSEHADYVVRQLRGLLTCRPAGGKWFLIKGDKRSQSFPWVCKNYKFCPWCYYRWLKALIPKIDTRILSWPRVYTSYVVLKIPRNTSPSEFAKLRRSISRSSEIPRNALFCTNHLPGFTILDQDKTGCMYYGHYIITPVQIDINLVAKTKLIVHRVPCVAQTPSEFLSAGIVGILRFNAEFYQNVYLKSKWLDFVLLEKNSMKFLI